MLLKLAPHIAECLERARASHKRADRENDPIIKTDFFAIEQHWLRLAESYRRVERMDAFISEAQRWRAMMQSHPSAGTQGAPAAITDGELPAMTDGEPSDAEVERLAERMVGKPPKPSRPSKRRR